MDKLITTTLVLVCLSVVMLTVDAVSTPTTQNIITILKK